MTLEITEHDRQAKAARKLIDFFVKGLGPVIPGLDVAMGVADLRRLSFDCPLTALGPLQPTGGAASDLMEPGSNGISHPEIGSLSGKDEERGLERILGVVIVADDSATHAKDHRAVALDQGCKCGLGRLAMAASELLEQLTIRQTGHHSHIKESLEVLDDGFAMFVRQFSGPG
jgi:hypothetical protein